MGVLRYLLALSVVIAHSTSVFGITLVGGYMAVQIFFIISGFYMAMVLNEKYNSRDYFLFISNRALRIYPIYWVVLILTLILSMFSGLLFDNWGKLTYFLDYWEYMSFTAIFFQVMSNIIIFGQDIMMFTGYSLESESLYFTQDFRLTNPPLYKFLVIPQAWTLSLELMFYLIAPFIVRRGIPSIILMILLGFIVRFAVIFTVDNYQDPWTYRFFPSELSLFFLGVLSFKIKKILLTPRKSVLNAALFFYSLLIIFFGNLNGYFFGNLGGWFLYLCTVLLLPWLFQVSKKSKIDSMIGELSYPVYISHMLIVGGSALILRDFQGESYLSLLYIIIVTVFSSLLIKYVSNPIDIYRRNRVLERHGL
ncbi:MAG: acyltransferase [Cocleimonas sp.]